MRLVSASVCVVLMVLAIIANCYGASSYSITASAGAGGYISPSGTTRVYIHRSRTFTVTPNSGYTIGDITVDGVSTGARSTYTFFNVTANHTIRASFRASGSAAYVLTITKGGTGSGTVTANPAGPAYAYGTRVTLSATPDANSVFAGYSGGCNTTSSTCTTTMTKNVSVTATFNAETATSYTITASAGAGGTISPSGAVSVVAGSGKTFAITPGSGYVVSDVLVDGKSVGPVGSYTFTNVTTHHTITASFKGQSSGTLLLYEGFEDRNWASRSWYDNTNHGLLATSGCYSGNCLQWSFAQAATKPTNGAGIRKLFAPTEEVFFTYYVKVSSNWQGSGRAYHPHMVMLLSDRDAVYQAPAYANLAAYFELNGSYPNINPVFDIQDSKLINTQYGTPPVNLAGVTESRAVAGCNGDLGDPGTRQASCYQVSGLWYNDRSWKNAAAVLTPNTWHKIEYHIKMNTIVNGATRADGILQMWMDGVLAIQRTNMVYRTAQQATKKWNQLFLGPYIGDGSPVAQTLWLDELSIYSSN